MNKINNQHNRKNDEYANIGAKREVVIARRSPKDVVKICPICFSPVRYIGNVFEFILTYECTNPDCGWKGNIVVEISKEDYEEMKEKQKKKSKEQKNG